MRLRLGWMRHSRLFSPSLRPARTSRNRRTCSRVSLCSSRTSWLRIYLVRSCLSSSRRSRIDSRLARISRSWASRGAGIAGVSIFVGFLLFSLRQTRVRRGASGRRKVKKCKENITETKLQMQCCLGCRQNGLRRRRGLWLARLRPKGGEEVGEREMLKAVPTG